MKAFFCFLCGLCGGMLGGMGMGGGTLLIPTLTLFLGFSQKEAQAINLVAFLPMAAVALIIHGKKGLVAVKTALPLIGAGVLFGGVGAFVMRDVSSGLLKKLFGGFLLVLACAMLISRLKEGKKPTYYAPREMPHKRESRIKKRTKKTASE